MICLLFDLVVLIFAVGGCLVCLGWIMSVSMIRIFGWFNSVVYLFFSVLYALLIVIIVGVSV